MRREKIIGSAIIVIIISIFLLVGYMKSSSSVSVSNKDVEEMFVDSEIKSENNKDNNKKNNSDNIESVSNKDNNESSKIYVEIKGQVKKPDVYIMQKGSIINDLIEKSGGLTEYADISSVNRASKLSDNQCVVIPKKGEQVSTHNLNSQNHQDIKSNEESSMININTAEKEELKKLTGIGDGRAQKIIDYREEHGEFKTIDDIKNVSGIGESIFNNIKNKICVK